jgi:tetratricopeptide (TPR) repeat protein
VIAPRSNLVVRLAIFAVIALQAVPAGAEPDADARAKAAEHFKLGRAFFQRGDYERARAEYQAALDLSAEPLLIFNIALCHDRANQPEPALEAFRRYLGLAPNGAVADEAREDVARLVPIVEQIAADRDKLAADRAAEDARQRDEAAKLAARPRPPGPPSRVPRYIVVAGAAVAAVGATAHVLAWRTRSRMVEAPDPDAYFAARDTFQLERNLAVGAYIAGAATIATGVILGIVMRPRVEVSVAVNSGAASLAVGWSR